MGIQEVRERFLAALKADPPPVPRKFELTEENLGPWLAEHVADKDLAVLEQLEKSGGDEAVWQFLHGLFVEAGLCHPTRLVK